MRNLNDVSPTGRDDRSQPTYPPVAAFSDGIVQGGQSHRTEASRSTPSSPLAVIVSHLHRCLNWKVLLGLVGVVLLMGVIAPSSLWRGIPILLLLVCPLAMLFMMRSMSEEGPAHEQGRMQQPTVPLTDEE